MTEPASYVNRKADAFSRYLKENNLAYFERRDLNDENHTVSFLTNIPAAGRRLTGAVLIDSSIYTFIRIRLGTVDPGDVSYASFLQFINGINAHHVSFKLDCSPKGEVFLDICVAASDDSFDPLTVHMALNVAVYFLSKEYIHILPRLKEN
jgi:hypothetical protein